MNKEYLSWLIQTSEWLFEETEKRLKYTPFDHLTFKWWLLYEHGPLFFALRDLLRRGNYAFSVHNGSPLALTTLDHTAILTPWSVHVGDAPLKVRDQWFERKMMALYYEAGDWGCPQQNFLFDWTEEQAWAYLVSRDLVAFEDIATDRAFLHG